jgi:DNA mismatch endonuclease (patch repair protein)
LAGDVFTPQQRSAVMRAVPAKNSSAELAVRRLLTRMGLRYRLHRKDLPGSPDVVLGPRKVAVFVHGCFWHGHDCARGARAPKTNAAYWSAKIGRNRARDAAAQAALLAKGWTPLIVWECELNDAAALLLRLEAALPRPPTPPPRTAARPRTRSGGGTSRLGTGYEDNPRHTSGALPMQTTNLDELERRVQAQEMVLTQLLAHQPNAAALIGHLEQMFTAKGPNTDTSDGSRDTTAVALGIIQGAKKVAEVHGH